MTLETSLARVTGLGSAKQGTHHWWMQRITAIALVPLTFWLVYSLLSLTRLDHSAVTHWIASPVSSAIIILFIISIYYHAILGIRVVIEDYVESELLKICSVITINFIFIFAALVSVITVIKVALGI